MRHFLIVFLVLISFGLKAKCVDGYVLKDNGCFVDVFCVNGADSMLAASFHLQTLSYIENNTNRFTLRDGNGTTFLKSLNDFSQFADFAALKAFLDPLRDACQSGGGGGGAVTVTTRDVERVLRCDLQPDGSIIEFYQDNVYDGQTGDFISTSINDASGVAYTITGIDSDCGSICLSNNEPQLVKVIGGIMTIPTNTVSSVSYVVTTGSANITIDSATPVPVVAGEPGSTWNAEECQYLQYPIIIDASGGGTVFVTTIK